ncbi:MAG: trigger factor [Pirellulales bacterium]|nr:trigger factor [Pirellulales bacterium]
MAAEELDEVATHPNDNADDIDVEDDVLQKLNLEVQIVSPSACQRHLTVTVAREDIDRYLNDVFSTMMPEANVSGFRAGRAPRKLVENRYKKEAGEQIKSSLLMDSLSQICEEESFIAIGEPELNLEAVEVPDEGPMIFEFDIEVRPDFDLPKWKGLKLKRPVRDFTDEDVDQQLEKMLTRFGQLVPLEGPAQGGDYLTVNIVLSCGGELLVRDEERVTRIRPTLSFRDGKLEGFDQLMAGCQAGDKRSSKLTLTQDAPNEELRGQEVDVEFEVLEVKHLKLPELTEEFLQEMGGFDNEEKLREAIRANLNRQLEYQQQQAVRGQITKSLTQSADWDLPPGLLKRQSARELERAVMELRSAGFSEAEIRARENQLRQNSGASTAQGLKEHFILERIAEEASIEVEEGDFEKEVFLMAAQSGESPRRVRAQIEKKGLMDVLQNQILERKVLEQVQAEAEFIDEPYEPERLDEEAIYLAAGGGDQGEAIPEATESEESGDESVGHAVTTEAKPHRDVS